MGSLPAKEQFDHLTRNAAEVVPADELLEKIERSVANGEPLRVKLGLDPTAPDVTLGWAVVLRKLREFQDLGHTAVLIVGDFTAQVGDPSGKSETRRRLSSDEVRGHAERLLDQFWRILDQPRTEVRYNSEWLAPMGMEDILRLTASYTVARMLERDDFAKRFAENKPISVMEFLYPLLQGQDSVEVEADVELGGTDQLFNLLVGRELQRHGGQEPQVAFTMPLLVGLDGVQKMSQSLGNYVGIAESASDIYGKLMSIPDGLMPRYFELITRVPSAEVQEVLALHPMEAKKRLAHLVTAQYRGQAEADRAEEDFSRTFQQRLLPTHDQVEEVVVATGGRPAPIWLVLREAGLVPSNSEARRMVNQGAVAVDGNRIIDPNQVLAQGQPYLVRVGKRRFKRVVLR